MSEILVELINCNILHSGIIYLENINWKINLGEHHIIVGPNGSGKTTFLKVISGLQKCIEGKIKVSENVTIGMMFQDYREILLPWLTVRKNIIRLTELKYKNKYNFNKGIPDFFINQPIISIEKLLETKIHKLSGGEQQKIALLLTLFFTPKLLLLDEPFSAIHYSDRDIVVNWLKEFLSKKNISCVIVTHNINNIESLGNKIFKIDKKNIIEIGGNHE